jgi:DNA-binding GntR family transcriptional regulator
MQPKAIQKIGDTGSLTDKAYRNTKEALRKGVFEPGTRLTSREVAAALGVSITPAREALGKLIAEGTLELLGPRTIVVPRLSVARYEQILETRLLLEAWAAEHAAKSADDELINEMEHIEGQFEEAREKRDFQSALDLNSRFHFTLYRRTGNAVIMGVIETLWLNIGPSLNLLYPKYVTDETGVNPHRKVLLGLKTGDSGKVRDAIVEDLETGAKKMRVLLAELED